MNNSRFHLHDTLIMEANSQRSRENEARSSSIPPRREYLLAKNSWMRVGRKAQSVGPGPGNVPDRPESASSGNRVLRWPLSLSRSGTVAL